MGLTGDQRIAAVRGAGVVARVAEGGAVGLRAVAIGHVSTTAEPKHGPSLQLDAGLVVWREGAPFFLGETEDFYFNDGSSAAGTHHIVPLAGGTLDSPWLADGVVVWIGRAAGEVDAEVFLMR